MNAILQATSKSVDRDDTTPISERVFGYVSESARDAMYDLVVQAYIESGVTKAALARRMKKDPGQVSRLLGAPGNWTIDTCAELLHAIDGSFLKVARHWPQNEPISNNRSASCLSDTDYLKMAPAWTNDNLTLFMSTAAARKPVTGSSPTPVRNWNEN